MRRVLLLLAAVSVGAGKPVSAQARAHIEAFVAEPVGDSRTVAFNLTDLTKDPTWREMLDASYPLYLRWKVQPWRSRGIRGASAGSTLEWNVTIEPRPVLGQYIMKTQYGNFRPTEKRFTSLEALEKDLELWSAAPNVIVPHEPGDWYYRIEVTITSLKAEQLDSLQRYMNRSTTDRSGQTNAITRLIQGGILGSSLPSIVLPKTTESFHVPNR